MKPSLLLPRTLPAKAAYTLLYPNQARYVGRSVALSLALHLLIAAGVGLGAYWFGIITLKDLLNRSSSVAASGPAPEQSMTLTLLMDEIYSRPTATRKPLPKPGPDPKRTFAPAPTLGAVPALPPLQLKSVAAAPSPTIIPSQRKAAITRTVRPKPRYSAALATGQGKSPDNSAAQVGSPGLPAPSYPSDALALREGGTVGMKVVFRQDGTVENAEVQRSSGFSILDFSTRTFIYTHWKNASLASTTIRVPVIYDPGNLVDFRK